MAILAQPCTVDKTEVTEPAEWALAAMKGYGPQPSWLRGCGLWATFRLLTPSLATLDFLDQHAHVMPTDTRQWLQRWASLRPPVPPATTEHDPATRQVRIWNDASYVAADPFAAQRPVWTR